MPATGKTYQVLLEAGAEQNLEAIYDHIAGFGRAANADDFLDQLMTVAESLSRTPDRGSFPKELVALGIREYRQVMFRTYRMIYRVTSAFQVIIYIIADGRRDMEALLARRLLGA